MGQGAPCLLKDEGCCVVGGQHGLKPILQFESWARCPCHLRRSAWAEAHPTGIMDVNGLGGQEWTGIIFFVAVVEVKSAGERSAVQEPRVATRG